MDHETRIRYLCYKQSWKKYLLLTNLYWKMSMTVGTFQFKMSYLCLIYCYVYCLEIFFYFISRLVIYHIGANRAPLLNRPPPSCTTVHFTNFIVFKYSRNRQILVKTHFFGAKFELIPTQKSILKNKTLGLYWSWYDATFYVKRSWY